MRYTGPGRHLDDADASGCGGASRHRTLSTGKGPVLSLGARKVARVVNVVAVCAVSFGPFGAYAQPSSAAPVRLLVNTHEASRHVYGGLHVGGAAWGDFTALLDAAAGTGRATTATLADRAALLQFDALWIDQRYMAAPSSEEIENVQAFIATGRRTVLVGENASWGPWNAAILDAVGGKEGALAGPLPNQGGVPGPGCQHGATRSVFTHFLTRDVSRVNTACGGYAVGGTALFDYNVASLWGPSQNVLTILDANVLDDPFGSAFDGRQFRMNVASWVTSPAEPPAAVTMSAQSARVGLRAAMPTDVAATVTTAPEPATVTLMAAGLAGCMLVGRRRRRSHDGLVARI